MFTFEFFASPDSTDRNSAQTILGQVQTKTDADGFFTLNLKLAQGLPPGQPYLSASVTDGSNVSSRFSLGLLAMKPVSITVSPATSTYGQNVTLTATVVDALGNRLKSGTVTFMDGARTLGTSQVVNGVATLSMANFSPTSHSFTAIYTPSDRFVSTSLSDTLLYVVTNPIPGTTPSPSAGIGVNVNQIGNLGNLSGELPGGVLTALIEYAPPSGGDGTVSLSFPDSVTRPSATTYGARGGENTLRTSASTISSSAVIGDGDSTVNPDLVVQELFDRPRDLAISSLQDVLDSTDLAGGILTGARPRPTLMMQKGRQSAPVRRLVSDDGTDDGVVSNAPSDERLPREHLLINPALPPGVRFRNPALEGAPEPLSRP